MKFSFNIPSLAELPRNTAPRFLFTSFFRGTGDVAQLSLVLFLNYIRAVDLATDEYELSRLELDRVARGEDPAAAESQSGTVTTMPDGSIVVSGGVVATSFPFQLLRATSHMEVSVGAIARAVRLLRRIRVAAPEFAVQGEKKLFGGGLVDRVLRLRNAIEHREGDLLHGAPDSVVPAFLAITTDGLELCGQSISFADVARCLRVLHDVGRSLRTKASASTE